MNAFLYYRICKWNPIKEDYAFFNKKKASVIMTPNGVIEYHTKRAPVYNDDETMYNKENGLKVD